MTIDLATIAGHCRQRREHHRTRHGWRGLRSARLRFDLNEDPGFTVVLASRHPAGRRRGVLLRHIPDLVLLDTGGTADIFVTTDAGSWNGTKIGTHRESRRAPTRSTGTAAGSPTGPTGSTSSCDGGNSGRLGVLHRPGPPRAARAADAELLRAAEPGAPARHPHRQGGNISALSSQAMTEVVSPASAACRRPARPLSCSTSPSTTR